MKKILKYISLALALNLTITSCLKDDDIIGPDAEGAVKNVIEFANIANPSSEVTSTYPLYIQAFDIVPSYDFNIPVQIVGKYENVGDVKVIIEFDNSIIEKYNEENHTEYVPLPTNYYQVPSTEVTIPGGSKKSNFTIKMLTDKFDFDNSYAVGLRIKSVSNGVISGNFGAITVAVSAKNDLDGVYEWSGAFADVVSPAWVHGSTRRTYTIELHTFGPDEVAMFDPYAFGDYLYPFYTGTGWSGYGSFAPVFKFDKATNKIVAVTNAYGQPAGNTRSAAIDPSGENTYDPTTKTIKVSYFLYQPSATPGIRAKFTETFKFKSPR